jgi:Kef-type K+ transport system membrane component KefB
MSLVLGAAYFAHKFGSPSILGTFTAGIALSQKFPRIDIRKTYHRAKSWLTKTACPPEVKAAANPLERVIENIEQTVFTLVWIFGPIFFVSVGLALNLKEIDFSSPKFWLLSLSLLAVAVVGKVAAGFFVLGRSLKEKAAIGFSMLPRGEVGLIFAEFGRAMGVINATEYAVVIFVVAITTLIAPLALKLLLKS